MSGNAAAHRRMKQRRRDAGMCYTCGKRPPSTGRARCAACITRCNQRDLANQHRNRAAGMCGCGAERVPGKARCSTCRERELSGSRFRRYGLTAEAWDELFASQDRRCAICRSAEPNASHSWHTDHNHGTGLVRGILCAPCNKGIGLLRESAPLLHLAAEYLAKWESKS